MTYDDWKLWESPTGPDEDPEDDDQDDGCDLCRGRCRCDEWADDPFHG